MNISKVTYSKVFPLGAYTNERIGAEVDLQVGDDPKQALADAKKLVEEFHREANPYLFSVPDNFIEGEQKADDIPPQPKSIPELINECKTVKELKSYRMIVYTKAVPPETQELYETKLRELQSNQEK